jgi:putative redox protein
MSRISVRPPDGDRFAVEARDHLRTVDQPIADGGQDTAPTPTELFVAGPVPAAGLGVTGDYELTSPPARAATIALAEGTAAPARTSLQPANYERILTS